MLDTIDQKAATAAEAWLQQAVDALTAVDRNAVESLFSAESYWRDVLALTWGLETTLGRKRIDDALCIGAPAAGLSDLKVEITPLPPRHVVRVGTETIEAFFTFSTNVGRGRGIVRLCADESEDESTAPRSGGDRPSATRGFGGRPCCGSFGCCAWWRRRRVAVARDGGR